MNVKTDTKEKFTVITPEESVLPANMTDELTNLMLSYLQKDISHVIINMSRVQMISETMATSLVDVQRQFYQNNSSFVICELQKSVEKILNEKKILDVLNITPTETEAWDIAQMEEIERELLLNDNEYGEII